MSPQPATAKRTRSTGPRTNAGKTASSKNALLHGLASSTVIMPGEDPAEYQALEQSLLQQFQPKNPVETILVTAMAKHHWLSRRAIRLQAEVLAPANRKKGEIPSSLAVLHRYQVSNDRAFHRCLETINALRKEELSAQKQFVSQPKVQPSGDAPLTPAEMAEFFANSPLTAQIARDCGYQGPPRL